MRPSSSCSARARERAQPDHDFEFDACKLKTQRPRKGTPKGNPNGPIPPCGRLYCETRSHLTHPVVVSRSYSNARDLSSGLHSPLPLSISLERWDYIFSYIKKLKYHKDRITPDRSHLSMQVPFMEAYVKKVR